MKKILITAYSLELGGIEKSLINLINNLKDDYKITLVLEKKTGVFLNEVPEEVDIIEYKIAQNKNVFVRKIKNFINFNRFRKKYKKQFDIGISYTTYSAPGSKLARKLSKKSILWIHGDYSKVYEENKSKMLHFYNMIRVKDFDKIVFVSKESLRNQEKLFPKFFKNKSYVCNNFINDKEILEKANEDIKDEKELKKFLERKKLFKKEKVLINVSRHSEEEKKITRIINAVKKITDEGKVIKVILIGDGPDNQKYKNLVRDYKLEDYIYFTGQQKNPYPYFKMADASILSSLYEGYPVVFLESMVLNLPIITTKVSEYKDIENKYGICVENSEYGVYEGIKYFIENDLKTQKFNSEEFNKKIKNKIIEILEK